jgi:hypothetical protein
MRKSRRDQQNRTVRATGIAENEVSGQKMKRKTVKGPRNKTGEQVSIESSDNMAKNSSERKQHIDL